MFNDLRPFVLYFAAVFLSPLEASRRADTWRDRHPQARLLDGGKFAASSDWWNRWWVTDRKANLDQAQQDEEEEQQQRLKGSLDKGEPSPKSDEDKMAAQFTKLFSFILANVHDPAALDDTAIKIPCYSCMSEYMQDSFPHLRTLYKKPLSFDNACDQTGMNRHALYVRNCTEMCVTLRIHDVVAGRRRIGFMRGCLTDITGASVSTLGRQLTGSRCFETDVRQLFSLTAQRQELEPTKLSVCGCESDLCNESRRKTSIFAVLLGFLLFYLTVD